MKGVFYTITLVVLQNIHHTTRHKCCGRSMSKKCISISKIRIYSTIFNIPSINYYYFSLVPVTQNDVTCLKMKNCVRRQSWGDDCHCLPPLQRTPVLFLNCGSCHSKSLELHFNGQQNCPELDGPTIQTFSCSLTVSFPVT